jgi:hypothetical protein
MKRLILSMAIVLAMILTIAAPIFAADPLPNPPGPLPPPYYAGYQTWYLSGSEVYPPSGTVKVGSATYSVVSDVNNVTTNFGMLMNRDNSAVTPAGVSVTLPPNGPNNGVVMWLANEPAFANVTFPSGNWQLTVEIKNVNNAAWASDMRVIVGSYNVGNNTVTVFPTSNTIVTDSQSQITHIALETTTTDSVPKGDYLSLVCYNVGDNSNRIILSGKGTFLTSPQSDPGYPLPELAAGVLLGAGILGLGGFMIIRRRNLAVKV